MSAPVRPAVMLLVLVAGGLGAFYFGFVHFAVPSAQSLLRQGGYFVALGTFAGWLLLLRRSGAFAGNAAFSRREAWGVGILVALLTAMALGHESFRAKILYDEYVLQATAFNLHFFRENSAIVRGYDLGGIFLSLDSYLDKRPIFFPFLLSLVHDLTGYRPANVFWLNGGLYGLTVVLFYGIGRRLNGWRGGAIAAVLLGSLPLFAQNASGAGMELLNVAMLIICMLLGAAWVERPDADRLSAFVIGIVLLVQSRYESALYVLPAAVLIALGWWRERRVILSWPAVLAPWLLVPVALQQKVLSNSPLMWELRENQTSRFSAAYLTGNLEAAWRFLSSTDVSLANSPWLGLMAGVALPIVLARVWAGRRRLLGKSPLETSLLFFGLGTVGITGLIMFYYWAELSDPMASRFALPIHLVLILGVILAARFADRRMPASTGVLLVAAVALLAVSAPKQSYHLYSHLGNDEVEWERSVVAARPPAARLLLVNKSTLPWMLDRTPAVLLPRARALADRIATQLHGPDFAEILVTQCARPRTGLGDFAIVPEDELPPWIHLQLVAERRFGTKLARISRLVAIDLPRDFKSTVPAALEDVAAATGRTGHEK